MGSLAYNEVGRNAQYVREGEGREEEKEVGWSSIFMKTELYDERVGLLQGQWTYELSFKDTCLLWKFAISYFGMSKSIVTVRR